ncbi:hypothetical protein [Stagnihabitans tardus]|uniref:DUF2975 domain-containing protein n=1 Tax=Stagnihabitans tardus TaxID=2699202 RepID=A0AAE4YB94_9RHOB|nr:hypothetical protein [Stagnihabitans tardus]NBZ89413.1 hypothetical protein [Stagnihabitans tardus]
MPKDRLFTWLDRGFWLVWAGFPLLIWSVVQATLTAPQQLAAQLPDQAACIASLPNIATAHPLSQAVFWSAFALENLVYAVLLAHAHLVIHRCARREVFVPPMIAILRRIGVIIMGFPVLDLGLTNLIGWTLHKAGDIAVFQPSLALDLPVLGVGLLLMAIAHAMRLGVALQRDVALTI